MATSIAKLIPGAVAPSGALTTTIVKPAIEPQFEFKAFLDRLGTPLAGSAAAYEARAKVTAFFAGLQISGLAALMDVVQGGMLSQADSLLNWLATTPSAIPGSSTAAPAWAGGNWTLDGLNDVLSTEFTPIATSKYQTASAHIALLLTTLSSQSGNAYVGTTGGNDTVRLITRSGALLPGARLNASSGINATENPASPLGAWIFNRVGDVTSIWVNGVKIGESTGAPTASPNVPIQFGKTGTSTYASGGHKLHTIGAGLTSTQIADLTALMLAMQ